MPNQGGATRKIIRIDVELCDGCGDCVTDCAEGALQIVDGVAKLVRDDFCDGFGDCVGACPTGALTVEDREAEPFRLDAVRSHLLETQGPAAVRRMQEAQHRHHHDHPHDHHHHRLDVVPAPAPTSSCPGARMRVLEDPPEAEQAAPAETPGTARSQLRQWPIQIHLVPPGAPFFRGKELVVMSTCAPLACPDVHARYLRGRGVVVGCPKLDDTRPYAEKLAAILQDPTIPKVIIPRMEVPCCAGLTAIVEEAVQLSGRSDVVLQEDIVGVDGSVTVRP